MLKKKLTGILTVVIAASVFSTVGLAQTEETKLFEDNFESGLSSEMWNVDSNAGLGKVKSDQEKWITTSSTQDSEFSYEYSAQKEDIAFNVTINASSWKETGKAFEMYVRYVNAENWFKLAYTPESSKLELIKCVAGVESTIATAEKQLEANKDYKLSLQAKHGVVRFELDGITLIQDYTGIDNFDKTADKNYAKFKTISQELKITALDVNEEDTLLHQQFANTGVIMTQSKTPQQSLMKNTTDKYTLADDSIVVTGTTAAEFQLAHEDWVQSSLGTDFAATEATYVVKIAYTGGADLHLRSNISTNGKTTYLARIRRDGYSLGDNYGANGHDQKIVPENNDVWGHDYGYRQYVDGEYHTYKVVTKPNDDNSAVNFELYIDGDKKLEWNDTEPAKSENENIILAGGIGFATTYETNTKQEVNIKSYELRDLNGSNKVMYEETFDNTYNWENANLVTGDGEDNKYYVTTSNNNGVLVVNDKQWKNVVADVDLRFDNTAAASTDNCAGILVRYVDANNYVMGAYSPYGSEEGKGTIFIEAVADGVKTKIASKEITAFESGVDHKLGISIKDGSAILFVDGKTALNAPLKKHNTNACGSIALKSNNIATKFDNVSVYGSPYYFVEDFNTTVDWSSYKDGASVSAVSDVEYENGTIKLNKDSKVKLYSDKDSTAGWDDIEYVVKMKTTATNLKGIYFRIGKDATAANYCINAGNTELMSSAGWKSIHKGESGPNINTTGPFEVRIRLTDVKTEAGEDAVRIRYTVDGTTYIDYVDDGSFVDSITDVGNDIKAQLAKFPLTSASHGRGFSVRCDGSLTGDNVIESITIVDPSAGTVVANVDAPTTFAANSDVEAKLTLENNGYETTKTMFITALYDDNGDIVDVKVAYPKLLPDVKGETVTSINTKNATRMEVYVWDNWDTMIPIVESKISTLTPTE